jgi:glutathione S-transferase
MDSSVSLKLIIGNKNYSSWSLRPWLAMKVANIPFEEEVVPLGSGDFEGRVRRLSGSGKVPLLLDGGNPVWESLAILEYLAEKFSSAQLWPADPAARARARVIAAEMHAGFAALRRELPMNMRRPIQGRNLSDAAQADVRRIETIWTDCRRNDACQFLFGAFSAADAMYAPVVARFHTYAVPVDARSRAYMDAVMALPAWGEWRTAALQETWILPEDEVDWPIVLK